MDWLGWIPEPATLDVLVWGILVVPVVVFGVPVLMASVRVPRRLELQEVPEDQLGGAQRRWFADVGLRLRELGFEPAVTFQAPNLPSRNLSRAFVNGMDGSVALAVALRDERPGSALSDNVVEFNSEFGDGTFVNTRSTSVSDLFDVPPLHHSYIHRTRDLRALKRHHDSHCRPYQAAGVRPVRADRVLARLAEFHQVWIAHQIARGLLRVRDTEWCGPTLRLALRGIASFFNPFGDRFSALRLLVAIASGGAVPLLVALALNHPGVPVISIVQGLVPMSNDLAVILALAPVFIAAAASVGWILESRAVMWAPLLASLVGWLTLPASTPDAIARAAWLLVLLATSAAGNGVSNARHRRQALV
jgi:hypothetical protein